ncbi:hypothetical protein SDC9_122137 [bioreactor metagenome]|uniref:Uncharacterized protein n=1 Tax=bioreactor metagenome TaxID=1076179 RepID=A0A645CDT9_9ZZZZ
MVDDRRFEGDLGQQEGVGLPAKEIEHHEPWRYKLAVGVRQPGVLIERPDETGVESCGLCLVGIAPFVGAVEGGSATGLEVSQRLPQHLHSGGSILGF